jgi:hypothetical protein
LTAKRHDVITACPDNRQPDQNGLPSTVARLFEGMRGGTSIAEPAVVIDAAFEGGV